MILDLVDNLAECKYLDCPPFPIDYRHTSNHVPITDEPSADVQLAESTKRVIAEIEHLEQFYAARVQPHSSGGFQNELAVHFGLQSTARATLIDSDNMHSTVRPTGTWAHRWVPPTSVHEDNDDYSEILREDGSL